MTKEVKTLKLTFNCADGKIGSLMIVAPKENLTLDMVKNAMENIITSNAIGSKTALFKEKVSAELLSRKSDEIYHA